jgi:hypothetical protein
MTSSEVENSGSLPLMCTGQSYFSESKSFSSTLGTILLPGSRFLWQRRRIISFYLNVISE